ncbi:zinc finger CCCH domain-containing protein 43-like, partial [Miscanthus floridulus]|uniref:zinc finger CCCH domain-containing protein 43-like n=1 Tax=Miscanthus floridulus TaxID=154761 RepID=UPI003458F0E2
HPLRRRPVLSGAVPILSGAVPILIALLVTPAGVPVSAPSRLQVEVGPRRRRLPPPTRQAEHSAAKSDSWAQRHWQTKSKLHRSTLPVTGSTQKRCNNREKGLKCNHVRFRKQGPKYLDDLDLIFGKVHVTGATAACPGDISSDESDDCVAEVPKPPPKDDVKLADLKQKGKKKRKSSCTIAESKEEKSLFYRMYKNTCLKIESAADRISSASATSASPTNGVPTIGEAMKMVEECGVEEGTPLMHTATMLIMKPEFREVFSHLKTNKGRLDVLEREHEKEMRR